MSHNFSLNNINVNKNNIYANTLKKTLKNKSININNVSKKYKKYDLSKKENNSINNLEELYEDTLMLLEMIKQQTEKTIAAKYNNTENTYVINQDNTPDVQNTLMKKKFLKTPLCLFLTIH